MNTKSFCYSLTVEAIPYNPDTVEYLFGKGAQHISSYPEDVIARDIIFDLVKDAIMYCLQMQTDFLARTKQEPKDMNERDKGFWDYLESKRQQYSDIEKTIKSISV